MRIIVVLLNWNGVRDTLECLRSLAPVPGIRILIVDNGSSDNSVEELSKQPHDLLVLQKNRGFAGGCNAGMMRALELGAEFIVLLSNDTVVAPDMIGHLSSAMNDPSVGLTGPVSYEYSSWRESPAGVRPRVWASGATINHCLGLTSHLLDVPDRIVDREYMPGVCWMLRSAMVRKVGGLPLGYEAYFEDAEYCLRVRQQGWRVVCVPGAALYHKVSRSMGGRGSPTIKYLSTRNRIAFLQRLHPRMFPWTLLLVSVMYSAEYALRILQSDLKRASAVLRGYRDGVSLAYRRSSRRA